MGASAGNEAAPGLAARIARHRGAAAGLSLLALVVLPALAAPWLPLADPAQTAPAQRMLPAFSPDHWPQHPLGTDHLGRDLLARLLWGARSSIAVGALATLLAALTGAVVGIAAGWLGRLADGLLMRGVDVLMAFPYLLLALAIVAALGPGLGHAMIAIAVANVPFFARAVRGAVLEIRHRDYIAAARLSGLGEAWIVVGEVLPNLAPTVLVLMTTTLGWMVLETAGLSFLGLGAQPPQADLGSMLGEGRELLTTYPRVAVLPGLVILLLVVGINLLGDALRDLIDPRFTATIDSGRRSGHGSYQRTTTLPAAPGDEPGPALLTVRGLDVLVPTAGGPAPAVRALDLVIRAGERVALVGESGSGKTLTALALMALLPTPLRVQGSIRLAGLELTGLDARSLRSLRGRRIAYVPQEPLTALDPLFRVGSQLDEALRAHAPRVDPRPRGDELLERVGLASVSDIRRRFPHQLSGGQRQRVAIAMALAHDPDLLIADEATTALDVTVQQEIVELLRALCAGGDRALLFVSHDLALVAGLCRRVLVMYAGCLVEDAPLAEIIARPAHPYTAALLDCLPELGRPEKSLLAIDGRSPMPGQERAGCAFAPRCPRARAVCCDTEPALAAVSDDRQVRCLFPLQEPR
ncbi:MAG: dipeptide/oligopeptide/nickel ABC transporter permease/ATP-binding protein [Thiohalocapsa sp.]|jgi:peptide/nickel transport system permease protein